jgi:hypothetical protein
MPASRSCVDQLEAFLVVVQPDPAVHLVVADQLRRDVARETARGVRLPGAVRLSFQMTSRIFGVALRQFPARGEALARLPVHIALGLDVRILEQVLDGVGHASDETAATIEAGPHHAATAHDRFVRREQGLGVEVRLGRRVVEEVLEPLQPRRR